MFFWMTAHLRVLVSASVVHLTNLYPALNICENCAIIAVLAPAPLKTDRNEEQQSQHVSSMSLNGVLDATNKMVRVA